MNSNTLLKIQDLYFSYDSSNILRQVNLEIQSGDALALVGPNGAGKTTLLNIIGGSLTPQQGRVCFTGVNLKDLRPKDRARLVAMVPQNPSVPKGFTALEMVLMGRNAHLRLLQWEGPRDVEKCRWAMGLTDTWGMADRPIWSLSGGEKQRVFIARALAQESRLLLLDEPTANLDIGYQPAILDMIEKIRKETGITVVAAMHDLTLAAQYFPKMAALYQGSVFALGSPEDVLRPDVVEAAFGTSVFVTRHPVHHTPVVLPVGSLWGRALNQQTSSKGIAMKVGRRKRIGLVIVNTGDGKGKTTAALGVLFRSWGRDMKVGMFQFIKHSTANFGEHRAGRKTGLEIVAMGDGFTWLSKDIEATKDLALKQWAICKERICSGDYDVLVLDELTYPLRYGWIATGEVVETLRDRPKDLHVIITGRYAPQELIDFADLVTEMKEIKHPYKQGIKAQPGIDF